MIVSKKKVKSKKTSAIEPEGRQLLARKSAKEATVKKKRLGPMEAELVEAFRAHWRSINAKIVRGVDVAQNRAHMFFATNDRERLRAARRYYAPARAAKLATASSDEILRLSEPWLSAAREFLESSTYLELRQLVEAEYVALVWRPNYSLFPPKGPASLVAPLPDESVVYGDVFEITVGGAILRVCKSVAEPFLKSERREAISGIELEFFQNARHSGFEEDEWRVGSFDVADPRAIDMDINERLPGEI